MLMVTKLSFSMNWAPSRWRTSGMADWVLCHTRNSKVQSIRKFTMDASQAKKASISNSRLGSENIFWIHKDDKFKPHSQSNGMSETGIFSMHAQRRKDIILGPFQTRQLSSFGNLLHLHSGNFPQAHLFKSSKSKAPRASLPFSSLLFCWYGMHVHQLFSFRAPPTAKKAALLPPGKNCAIEVAATCHP